MCRDSSHTESHVSLHTNMSNEAFHYLHDKDFICGCFQFCDLKTISRASRLCREWLRGSQYASQFASSHSSTKWWLESSMCEFKPNQCLVANAFCNIARITKQSHVTILHLQHLKNLTNLHFGRMMGSKDYGDKLIPLWNSLTKANKLRELAIVTDRNTSGTFTATDMLFLSNEFSGLIHLEKLILSHCLCNGAVLSKMKQLKRLGLQYCECEDLSSCCDAFAQLIILNLDNSNFSGLHEALKQCTQLKKLSLKFSNSKFLGVNLIRTISTCLPQLVDLNLLGRVFERDEAPLFQDLCCSLPHLVKFQCQAVNFSPVYAENNREMLQCVCAFPKLVVLLLCECFRFIEEDDETFKENANIFANQIQKSVPSIKQVVLCYNFEMSIGVAVADIKFK